MRACRENRQLAFPIMDLKFNICPGNEVADPQTISALKKFWELLKLRAIECDTMTERAIRKQVFLTKELVCFDKAVDATLTSMVNHQAMVNGSLIEALVKDHFFQSISDMQLLMASEFLWGFLNSTELPKYDKYRDSVNTSHAMLAQYNYSGFLVQGIQYLCLGGDHPGSCWPVVYDVDWKARYHEALWVCNPSSCQWSEEENLGEAFWRVFDGIGGAIKLGSIVIFLLLSMCFYEHLHDDGAIVSGLAEVWVSVRDAAYIGWSWIKDFTKERLQSSTDHYGRLNGTPMNSMGGEHTPTASTSGDP